MANIKKPQFALPFTGLLSSADFDVEIIYQQLTSSFGERNMKSEVQPFTQTNYYNKEMGDCILRQWWVFKDPCDPGHLADMKHTTNAIEQLHLNDQGNRRVNIDPGLITMSNIVLASTKNYSHRVYLGKGIYAEVTLIYKGKTYTTLDWTYPDYRNDAVIDFFNQARTLLKDTLAKES